MSTQLSRRAIPFGTNGKPPKTNSQATVIYKFTRKEPKAKPIAHQQPFKRLVSASYDPLTGFLYETQLTLHKHTKSQYKSSKRFLLLWGSCA